MKYLHIIPFLLFAPTLVLGALIDETVVFADPTDSVTDEQEDRDFYGSSVTGIGDLNGDGIDDILVGAKQDSTNDTSSQGSAHIHFMNADGSIQGTANIGENTENGPGAIIAEHYGTSVASIGDVNGDGVDDIAVGAPSADSFAGIVYIHFMQTDGSILSTVPLTKDSDNAGATHSSGDYYGSSLAGIGDVDGDGTPDIAVGARSDEGLSDSSINPGAVFIHFLESDGSIRETTRLQYTSEDNAQYGSALAGIGDMNSDGTPDIAVSAPNTEVDGATSVGTVYVHLLNSDGTISSTTTIDTNTTNGPTISSQNPSYGSSMTSMGDLDDNGVDDLLVSAINVPAFYIHYMNSDGSVSETLRINEETTNGFDGESDWYAYSVGSGSDIDGNGVNDILFGLIDYENNDVETGGIGIHLLSQNNTIPGKTLSTVSKSNGVLTVRYTDDSTDTIRPFGNKKRYDYIMAESVDAVLAYNGKRVRAFVNGERVAQKKVRKKMPKSKNQYGFLVEDIYDAQPYESLLFASVQGTKAQVVSLRLNENHQFTKLKRKKLRVEKGSSVTISGPLEKKNNSVTFTGATETITKLYNIGRLGKLKQQ